MVIFNSFFITHFSSRIRLVFLTEYKILIPKAYALANARTCPNYANSQSPKTETAVITITNSHGSHRLRLMKAQKGGKKYNLQSSRVIILNIMGNVFAIWIITAGIEDSSIVLFFDHLTCFADWAKCCNWKLTDRFYVKIPSSISSKKEELLNFGSSSARIIVTVVIVVAVSLLQKTSKVCFIDQVALN